MLDRVGRTSLKLAVAAAVVAWTSMPPAIVHSHSDGDDPAHGHEVHAAHHDHHHHGLSQVGDHVHAKPVGADFVESRTIAVHCHWQLLGFCFALPVSGQQGDREDERYVAKMTIVALADGDGLAPPTGIALAYAACQPNGTVLAGIVPLSQTPQDSQRQSLSTPLCDRARHERSGVQLA